jgi:hypothetical protein
MRSPLSRRLYDELQSDPVWAEFWTAITPRIPEIYKAANGFTHQLMLNFNDV